MEQAECTIVLVSSTGVEMRGSRLLRTDFPLELRTFKNSRGACSRSSLHSYCSDPVQPIHTCNITSIHCHTPYTITTIHCNSLYTVKTPSANSIGTSHLSMSKSSAILLANLVTACLFHNRQPHSIFPCCSLVYAHLPCL